MVESGLKWLALFCCHTDGYIHIAVISCGIIRLGYRVVAHLHYIHDKAKVVAKALYRGVFILVLLVA